MNSTKTKIQGGIGQEHYTTKMSMRGHTLIADEPESHGGRDAGPTATELIMSGLAACTMSTLRMYADRKDWQVDRIDVEISFHAKRTESGQISYFDTLIDIKGDLTTHQKDRMIAIARKCPIHKLLTNAVDITTHLKRESGEKE